MSTVAKGDWRYELRRGGVELVALSDCEQRALALDQRLAGRLASIAPDEATCMQGLLAADLATAVCRREAVEGWRADGGQRLLATGPAGAGLLGVSQVGEFVDLGGLADLPEGDLWRRVLRWGNGRAAFAFEPVQVAVLPALALARDYAESLCAEMEASGLRAVCELEGSLARRLRLLWLRQVPYVLVVGPREAKAGLVELRQRGSRRGARMARSEAVSMLRQKAVGA